MLYEQSAVPNTSDRRRHKRHRCPLPIEITSPDIRFPVRGETSDVSLSGCYVNTLMPFPKDTMIEIRLSVDSTEIRAAACVRTCDQGVGNGIEFREPSSLFCQTLQAKLDEIIRQEEDRKAG